MTKHPSSPSVSSPSRKSPLSKPADDAMDLSSSSPPAGFIFMCSGATKPECFRYRVLGLPRGRLNDVSRIRRGAGLFLYDFDGKYLYGPYCADSDGGLALEPAAFQGRYPAQVKFTIDGDFMPIPESSVRSAIKENYSRGKFWPELTVMQVEKLRALFRPITAVPESPPLHYVDNSHPAPSAAYLPPSAFHPTQAAISRLHAPSATYLTPTASHQTVPAAYVHHPSSYVPAPAAHLVAHEPYSHPYSHLPPLAAQFTAPAPAPAHCVTTTGHPYQAGYEAHDQLPATYHYAQAPPSCYFYAQTQQPMPEHVPVPFYSSDPYFTANRNDPYRFDAVKSHYQETTSERTAYAAAPEVVATNLQLVRHYGYTPSSKTAAPEEATTNLALVRSYGFVPGSATEGTSVQFNVDGAAPTSYSYAGAPATENVAAPSVYAVASASAYL